MLGEFSDSVRDDYPAIVTAAHLKVKLWIGPRFGE